MLYNNEAGQSWRIFAFNRATNAPVTGDAANITAKLALDRSILANTVDVNPTEIEDGYYVFNLALGETIGSIADLYPESSTPGVQVIGIPGTEDIVVRTPTPDTDLPVSTLAELALAPKRTRTAEGTVEERTVDELIKADRYLNPAPDAVPWGIRIARTKPPSSCS